MTGSGYCSVTLFLLLVSCVLEGVGFFASVVSFGVVGSWS